jgi:acyl-CoA thioester hydrolase
MTGLEHRIRIGLRWRDMDMLGHLNQSVYHELLEEGRAAVMHELGRRAGSDQGHGAFVLAHVDLDYRREVRRDDEEVEIVVRVAAVGRSSIRLEHDIWVPARDALAASGTTVLVAWDPATRAKRPLTDRERESLISTGP